MTRLLTAAIHLVLLIAVSSAVVAENAPQPLIKNLNLPPASIDFDLSDLVNVEQKRKIKPSLLRVGVYYSDEFRNFVYQEVIRGWGRFEIDLGTQSLNIFRGSKNSCLRELKKYSQPH